MSNRAPAKTTTKAAQPAKPTVPTPVPTEKIAMRAYERWCERGCPHGTDQEDWYQAEQDLLSQANQQPQKAR